MSHDPVSLHFQLIRQHLERLQQEDATAWAEIEAVLEDLHVICEEMQTSLEAVAVIEQQLLQQNQHYRDLFQTSPIAYLLTDADGVILEANQATAQMLNVPYPYLAGKPLIQYVAENNRLNFRNRLDQLAQNSDPQVWQLNLRPQGGKAFAAYLQVAVSRTRGGQIENLKIGIFNFSQAKTDSAQANGISVSPLPYALDGLRVLIVDDEAGICQFIAALLASHGIEVRAVTDSAAALEEIEQFHPDVLLSDLRMPGTNGYDLIRQIRALEQRQGRHIPAAAITAYLDEDREKALNAGYEAYWYKLSQPTELVEVVVRLAERAASDNP